MDVRTALVKYVFLDIVRYSVGRTIEAQTEIIHGLNQIILHAVGSYNLPEDAILYLPTGDGICIGLINVIDPFDIHLLIAQAILRNLDLHNNAQNDPRRRFQVRIGINENHDNLVIDINGRPNVAGAGINDAQRIMDAAGPDQIFLGQSVYEKLSQRDLYSNCLKRVNSLTKHQASLTCYRYCAPEPSPSENKPGSGKARVGGERWYERLSKFVFGE